ncbi:MAG: peptide deformylase [Patescibacteria group bacterium]|nr:peptide deformylase [Patescibacteria group bacterium]
MIDIFRIVTYKEPSIRERSIEVPLEKITTKEFQDFLDKLMRTFDSQNNAAGLAAPQCGVNERAVIVQVGLEAKAMINPEIIKTSTATAETEEGCFSVPGVYGMVIRPKRATVKFIDRHGRRAELDLKRIEAVAVQHEIDHLDGVLFVDKATKITQGKWPA